VFTGRVVEPGEPEFLPQDTDGALALAEEEAATCPSCGMLMVWCRDPEHQFAFEPAESVCWPTYRLAAHQASGDFKKYDDATRAAIHVAARFREGKEPDPVADLGLLDVEVD
jgi:hypothetical protein